MTITQEPEMQAHDTIQGGWVVTLGATAMSGWNWLTAGANGMTIILTALSIALAAIKLADAVRAWRATDRGAPVGERLRSTFGTRPSPLEDDR